MRNSLHSDNAANAMHSISGHVNFPLPAATLYRIRDGDHCIRLLFFFCGSCSLLSGVMEVAGSQALGALTSVLHALDAMPGDEWEDEDEKSYYSDEDGDEEVSPDLAGRGIGECEEYSSVSRCGAELCRTPCWRNIAND